MVRKITVAKKTEPTRDEGVSTLGKNTVSMMRQYRSHILSTVFGILFTAFLALLVIWFRETHNCTHDSYTECNLSFMDLCEKSTTNSYDRASCQCSKCKSCEHLIKQNSARVWNASVCGIFKEEKDPTEKTKEKLNEMVDDLRSRLDIKF